MKWCEDVSMGMQYIYNNYITLVTVMAVNMYIYIFMQFLCSFTLAYQRGHTASVYGRERGWGF